MRTLAFAFLLVGVSLIAGSVYLHLKTGSLGPTPEAVARMERMLARPGLLALATLNVRALVDLDVIEPPEEGEEGLAAELAAAGVDLRRDVSHATVALGAPESGEPRVSLALFGRFEPAAIERLLRERPEVEVEGGGDGGVLRFTRIDPDSCEPSGPWAAHLTRERVLVAHADEIGALLGDAPPSDAALRDLARFQRFRGSQLASAAVFVPDELPDTGNPFVTMAAQGAARQVAGFRALYAGASPRIVPPGLDVDALLEALDADVAADRAAAWQQAIEAGRAGLGQRLPALAAVLDALAVRAEGRDLHAELRLGSDAIERLRELPAELGRSLFGGSVTMAGSGEAPPEEIDRSPLSFLPEASARQLADYDPGVTFAGKVDETSGPLGVRLAAVRLGEDGGPAELEIEAFATGVPNLGDRGERAEIRVTSVESHAGDALLAAEHCGDDRNDLPAPLTASFVGDVLNGSKTLRLREGALPGDVARIAGTASIRLPVKTESVRLPAEAGQVAERAGARVEITKAVGGSLSYTLSGETSRILHLRALNQAGRPLARRGSSSMGSLFGSGSSGSLQFAGRPHALEAVFALEEEELAYPFTLEGARPGTDGEMFPAVQDDEEDEPLVPLAATLDAALQRLAGDFVAAVERAVGIGEAPLARRQAGPFVVSLEGVWSFGGLMPRIEVQAPEVQGLTEIPTAVELRLDELRMRDGTAHTGGWSEMLSLGQGFGREGLSASAQLQTGVSASADDLASLRGAVVLRLPERVGSLRFPSADLGARVEAPGLSARIVELGRDRLVVRATRGGDRLIGVRAFTAHDDELLVSDASVTRRDDGSVDLEVQLRGIPHKLDLRWAEKLSTAEHPFTLKKTGSEIARSGS